MKTNSISYIFSLFMMIATLFSCSDEKLDSIGSNPNNPTEVPISVLLPQVEVDLAVGVCGTDLAWYSSVFVEHTTGVHGQLEQADKRQGINSSIGNNSWNNIYANLLQDLSVLIDRGSEGGIEEGSWHTVGIAKVIKAYAFSVATDLWGDVPYSEATDIFNNTQPQPEAQSIIYEGMQDLLDEAIVNLDTESVITHGTNDLYFEGDASKWTKTAYALKARLYNRLSKRDPEGSAISALNALENAYPDDSSNFIFNKFDAIATAEHPWFQELNDRSHHAVSETIYELMNGLDDPRSDLWFGLRKDTTIVIPAPSGLSASDQAGSLYSRAANLDAPSTTGNIYLSATSELPLITFEEVKFIEAEANLRLGNTSEAYDAYLEAVEASLIRAGASTAYLSSPNIAVGEASLTLETIINQKYISFWLFQPIEAYNDYRRTGFPVLNNPEPAPARFPYTTDELAANPNIKLIGTGVPVWWAE